MSDAPDKLIEAVEAGAATMNDFASVFPSESAYGKTTWGTAHNAFSGSLDAAQALHEALAFYADDANWRQNGPLDPNSADFTGGPARAALAAAPQPDVIGRADNMPLADMARAEAFRTLARCIRDPAQPRKMGLSDLEGVLAWEERRIAALAAAPQPAPMDREALVGVIDAHVFNALGETSAEAIADALLARGLRLAGGDETRAWAVVREDGAVLANTVRWGRDDVDAKFGDLGPAVRVAIRVVEGGDDAA